LINGARVNSCLTLAGAQDGNRITTIEGIAVGGGSDVIRCGMLDKWRKGMPSAVSPSDSHPELSNPEVRERMAGKAAVRGVRRLGDGRAK
jgi:aerobic-type carbon monoxide dehydrogenase small subunit (CoxS/CutS family)